MPINTMEEILKLAINREQEAFFFYSDLLESATEEPVKQALQWMAEEELRHRRFLVRYRDGQLGKDALDMRETVDYRIAEYLDAPEEEDIGDQKDVYLVAAHRELNSHQFYKELSGLHHAGELREVLLKMANEELKHKEKMEYLYANSAFPQTAGG